jgi:hypothetical protein
MEHRIKAAIYLIILLSGSLWMQGCASSKPQKPKLTADDARAYFEELRSAFNTGKIRALNKVMKLTVAEADKFWPIYRNYEKDLAPVGDRKLAIIREFLTHRKEGTLTNEKAKELSAQWLQNAQERLELWKQYHAQISEGVSPLRAAQFLQVENQMALFVDISIASEMPMIGSTYEAQK